ncbi:uncharacterized protein [Montipora foliosa]|uniref:uncharacterized protein n=1 Tax=Montipora foliosa TaxID=591990 RepID=UPI0035F1A9AC
MAFQISEATRQPYTTFEKKEGFRKYVQDRLSSVLNRFAGIRTWASVLNRFAIRTWTSLKTLGCACITYVTFFAWQIIGLILYTIRAFEASISAKHTSFQETHIELFRYSAYLQLVWLLTSLFNTGLVIVALSKVPSFLGYAVILRKLVRLPSFWSLVALTAVTMSGYLVILAIKNHTGMEIALIVAFMVERPVQVILLAVLSFTQVNHSRQNGTFRVFTFIKVNVFLLLVNYFIQFVIGSIQFALNVYGIDKETEIDSQFYSVLGAIRRFAVVIFCYRIYIFHWEKLFVDNRNILCHHEYFRISRRRRRRRCDTVSLTTV